MVCTNNAASLPGRLKIKVCFVCLFIKGYQFVTFYCNFFYCRTSVLEICCTFLRQVERIWKHSYSVGFPLRYPKYLGPEYEISCTCRCTKWRISLNPPPADGSKTHLQNIAGSVLKVKAWGRIAINIIVVRKACC